MAQEDRQQNIYESFVPQTYRIYWTAADPGYDVTYRLVPVIALYESGKGGENGSWTAYLQFYPADKVPESTIDVVRKSMYLNYSEHGIDASLVLVADGASSVARVEMVEQDGRLRGSIVSPLKKIV